TRAGTGKKETDGWERSSSATSAGLKRTGWVRFRGLPRRKTRREGRWNMFTFFVLRNDGGSNWRLVAGLIPGMAEPPAPGGAAPDRGYLDVLRFPASTQRFADSFPS